jgi:hypothetical protein
MSVPGRASRSGNVPRQGSVDSAAEARLGSVPTTAIKEDPVKRTRRLGLAVIALVALAAGVALAAKSYETTVVLKYHEGVWKGRATADGGCQKGRKVTVTYNDGKTTVGSDTTNADGKYSVQGEDPPAPGEYHATAKKKTITVNGKKHICEEGESAGLLFAH